MRVFHRIGARAALALGLLTGLAPAIVQAQDVAAGEKLFARCRSCHQVGEGAKNGIGPELNGIVGQSSGAVAGFRNSDALKRANLVWDEATLHDFLKKPAAMVPGNRMAFPGIAKDDDRADLIAFLKRHDASGHALP